MTLNKLALQNDTKQNDISEWQSIEWHFRYTLKNMSLNNDFQQYGSAELYTTKCRFRNATAEWLIAEWLIAEWHKHKSTKTETLASIEHAPD